MNILLLTIPVAFLLAFIFVGAFIWATRQGQFDDLVTPAHRMLFDEEDQSTMNSHKSIVTRKDKEDVDSNQRKS